MVKTTEMYSPVVLKRNTEDPNQGISRATLPLEAPGNSLFCFFQLLVADSLLGYWLHHSNLCLDGHIVSWSVFSSVCLRTLVTGRRSYPHNPGSSPHLKIFVQLFAMPWTVAYKAALSMEFSRQEYWSGLPFPFPGDLPDPGIESRSPTLQADDLPSEPRGKPTVISAETSVSK